MTTTQSGFAAFRGPVEREVFEPGFTAWERAARPLRRALRAVGRLPDRGGAAVSDEVPPEFFRFPPV